MPTPTFTFHDETWLKGYAASGCLQLTDMSETKMTVATAAFQASCRGRLHNARTKGELSATPDKEHGWCALRGGGALAGQEGGDC